MTCTTPLPLAVAVLLGVAGCTHPAGTGGPDGPSDGEDDTGLVAGAAALVQMDAWEDAGLPDPLEEHRPDGAVCEASAWGLEGATLEVDTGACDFLSVTQPLRVPLRSGEPLELVFWHTWLTAEEPAEGHLALFVGDALLYEYTVDIPSDPASQNLDLVSPVDADAGTPVTLHLHNHGANTWNLLRLERVDP